MPTTTRFEDGKLIVERLYPATREAVFEAWIETGKIERWWGCAITTDVKASCEPRVGGVYAQEMTLRGGIENPMRGVITAFDPPRLLAYRIDGPTPDAAMTVDVRFEERPGGTLVTLTQSGIPEAFQEFVADGWGAGFGRLYMLIAQDALSV